MAIDTRRERQNVAQVGCPLPVSVLPTGSIGPFMRAQISWTYAGIGISPPAGAAKAEDHSSLGGHNQIGTAVTIGGFN